MVRKIELRNTNSNKGTGSQIFFGSSPQYEYDIIFVWLLAVLIVRR